MTYRSHDYVLKNKQTVNIMRWYNKVLVAETNDSD